MEWLLLISLIFNGWQFHSNGESSQSIKQLEQTLSSQEAILGECYARSESMEDVIIKTEASIRELTDFSKEQSIQLEKLRNSSPVVDDYLQREIPSELLELLNSTPNSED